MLSLPPAVRIYLCTQPTDMRKSFDGLAAIVEHVMGEDPLSGHLFLFRNRRRDRIKALYFDDDGLALWYKRLERGAFQFPSDVQGDVQGDEEADGQDAGDEERTTERNSPPGPHAARAEIRAHQLSLILGGIELRSVQRRRRWSRPS